jgi:DNA polymerase-3 subunit beta
MMIVKSAIKLMDGKSDYTVYTVGDKNYKLASSDGYEIIFRKMEGKYPNVNSVIPPSFNTEVTLNKKDFVNKITEAKICESQASNLQVFKLDVVKKSLTVSSQDIDFGQSYCSTLPVEPVSGEDIEIGFKSDFLLKALKHDPKKDDVTLKFIDPLGACVIDGKILVMPMKIS